MHDLLLIELHHAYRPSELRERHHASFRTDLSATADIQGVLLQRAQVMRSLSVLALARSASRGVDVL